MIRVITGKEPKCFKGKINETECNNIVVTIGDDGKNGDDYDDYGYEGVVGSVFREEDEKYVNEEGNN